MEILIALVVILVILLVSVTLIGHGIWLALAWILRQITGAKSHAPGQTLSLGVPAPEQCFHCHVVQFTAAKYCPRCGAMRPTTAQQGLLRELEGTLRQLDRLHQAGALDEINFRVLKKKIDSEREHIIFPQGRPGSAKQPSLFTQTASPRQSPQPQVPRKRDEAMREPGAADTAPGLPPPFITHAPFEEHARDHARQQFGAWVADSDEAVPATPVLKPPRRPFAEVLAAFMEQSNIRWGEIVGGILIVGCSTALVISLWAQISSIPVLKFLIFTTVTAALFGVGFYTEHRWKLPTTSRGILTIAVLLVPLNFLAIAAVSGSTAPPGALVISSELVAPALFLCLVYFAGRVITSSWPQLLAAGVLTSSVGQLLIRHFGATDNSPALLFALGAFPVLCYVAAAAWMLRRALADGEIDEGEANEIFITLGAVTFAVSLPFGLLLYRSGPIGMSMMHLAPLVTLAGTPMLASGALLWRRTNKDLAAARTVGTSLALLGTAVVLSGMFLSWPNPASLVPAALLSFAVLTAIAVFLKLPPAHFLAAGCLSIAYVVAFQVIAGNVPWRNLRVTSLLQTASSVSTGQALIIPFVVFTLAHEWLKGKQRERDALSYFFAAGAVAIVSLLLVTIYGVGIAGDPHYVSAIFALYTAGAFWFAGRKNSITLTWAAAVLLFFTAAQVCTSLLSVRFPWQATLLSFAAACTGGAVIVRHYGNAQTERLLIAPLQKCAVAGSALAATFLLTEIISLGFEPSSLLAVRTFGLAVIWLGLFVLIRTSVFFTAFQMTLTLGAILSTKSFLQRFDWYAYQPNAWLHPWALQILGSVLGLMCLAWIVIRLAARKYVGGGPERDGSQAGWSAALHQGLEMPIAFDHLLAGALAVGFALLTVFGAASGISKELTNVARNPPVFDLAGFPHGLIFGAGGWILWAILLAVMFGNLRERRRSEFALGALVILWTVCPLLAGRFEPEFATASVGRWCAAIFLLVVSIAFAFRERLFGSLTPGSLASLQVGFANTRAVLLFLTLAPLLFLTLSPVVDSINYVPARGPQAGIFRTMGSIASYSFPLIIVAAALGIHAVRERSAGFAFATGLLVNLTVTVVHVMSVATGNGVMNRVVLANSLQLNAIAAACVALVWMATRDWWIHTADPLGTPLPLGESRGEGVSAEPKRGISAAVVVPLPSPLPKGEGVFLTCQKLISIALNAVLIVPVALHLIALPYRTGPGTFAAGELNGWLAVLLTVAVVIAFDKVFRKPLSVASLSLSLLSLASLGAFGFARFGVAKWAGLHVLLGSFVLIAWLLLLARHLPKFVQSDERKPVARLWTSMGLTFADDWERDSVLFATAVGAIVVLVALRGPFIDPLGAWWSIGALVAMSALAASLNWVSWKRVYLYAAGILFNTAVAIWLIKYQSDQISSGTAFIEAIIIALSLTSVLWLALELRARRLAPKLNSTTAASFHNFAALLSLMVMGIMVAFRLSGDFYDFHQTLFPLLDWFALFSLALLMAACLWDRHAGYAVAGLYLLGLMNAATLFHHLGLPPRRLAWALMMAGAIHALAAATIWRARVPIIAWAKRLKIPPRIDPIDPMDPTVGELKWLSFLNSVVIATVIGLAFWIVLRFFEWPLRVTASLAVAAQALTFGLMAQGRRRVNWQRAAVAVFLFGVVFFGWSWLTPGAGGTWLNRSVILMAAMFAIIGLFGAELDKLIEKEPDWTKAFRDCVPAMAIAGALSLAFVLGTEIYYQIEFGAVRINPLPLLVVALTLAAGVAICIVFAISPRHDPLGLSERRRSNYVYVAEIMLGLLFMHIRLTMPWLFTGFFERYWPLVVVAIAYTGVVISEVLRRRQVLVLAQPIERTGALLPLLPVLGFWIAQSQVDYSTLLFVVGGLYGLLSILRKSFWFGLVAALAGNAGLWYLLHHTSEYRFWQHPQLWLIPAAVSVLIAAHLNRKDFSESQMTGIRYMALVTIYVSSTADIFINGVAQSPWLPLVLAGLSLAGVFGGMIFRIRAFLLLGSIFLLLAIAMMINYAAVNFHWTWLWYVAGIVTGALIIATFAVFEKRRADVLRVVDGLKDWQR